MAASEPVFEEVFSPRSTEAVREHARTIASRGQPPLTDWESTFVNDLPERRWQERFTKVQVAKLDEIDFLSRVVTEWKGQPTQAMLATCYNERWECDEDDEAWLTEIWQREHRVIYGRDVRRLARLADRINGDPDD